MRRYRALSRRALLTTAAQAGLALTARPAAAAGGLRFVPTDGLIKGISSVAPITNWAAASYGLTPHRISALHRAGFNTLRLFIPLATFEQAQDSGDRNAIEALTTRWMDYLQNGIDAGFKVLVSWGSSFEERTALLDNGARTTGFRAILATVARGLANRFAPEDVAFEIMNEPAEEQMLITRGYESWSAYFAPMFCAEIRAAAPELTIVVQAASGGWSELLPLLDLTHFDANVVFCFHFYTPGEFSHQGANYPDFHGIPFPITRYPGGRAQMQGDIEARVERRVELNAAAKSDRILRYQAALDYLWYPASPLSPDWVAWPKLDSWITAQRLDPRRFLCGEFGVVSELNFNGSPGCDLPSRASYLRAIRQNVEAHGFGGWVAHQAFGDFNLFEQQSVSRHGHELIPELVAALFD